MNIHIDEHHIFADVFARVQRSKHIFLDLKTTVQAYLENNPYRLAQRIEDGTGDNVTYLESIVPVPYVCAHLTSEFLHHLRSTLDNLAFILVKRHRGDDFDESKVQFPIFNSMTDFKDKGKMSNLLEVFSKKDLDQIVSMKPARDGLALFWIIHRLNIIDKHRFMLRPFATAQGIGWKNIKIKGEDGSVILDTTYAPPPWKLGDEVARARANGYGGNVSSFPVSPLVQIHAPSVIEPSDILGVLGLLGDFVDKIANAFILLHEHPEADTFKIPLDWYSTGKLVLARAPDQNADSTHVLTQVLRSCIASQTGPRRTS